MPHVTSAWGEVAFGNTVVHVLLARIDALPDDGGLAIRRLAHRRHGVRVAQALVRRVLGLPDAAIGRARSGKPFLRALPGAGLSVSHSGPWVAAALCATSPDVGLDVEEPRAVSEALVRQCCADADRVLAAGAAERARRFVSVWTVQEALVKATGEGLRGRPFEIPIRLAPDTGEWRGLLWARTAMPVAVAVAVRTQAPPCRATWRWTGDVPWPESA